MSSVKSVAKNSLTAAMARRKSWQVTLQFSPAQRDIFRSGLGQGNRLTLAPGAGNGVADAAEVSLVSTVDRRDRDLDSLTVDLNWIL